MTGLCSRHFRHVPSPLKWKAQQRLEGYERRKKRKEVGGDSFIASESLLQRDIESNMYTTESYTQTDGVSVVDNNSLLL